MSYSLLDPAICLLIAVALATHGLRRKSLAPSGALAALVVGFLTLTGGTKVFGIALIGFYLIGSRATKYGKKTKARLEEGNHASGAGYRSGRQVFCNSAAGLVAAFLWNAAFAPTSVHARIARAMGADVTMGVFGITSTDPLACPVDKFVGDGWSRALLFAALGHFACCLGDTLASELGILGGTPLLITTMRPVPRGTNGGVSLGGTLASFLGGGLVGLLIGVGLALENWTCGVGVVWTCVGYGLLGGGFGSLV
ncbi:hypothetical protein BDN70DRAFT_812817 [Pholiota conissans]|uniref:DUF92 domain-containing protein n=1 Tax=Pholiota conissans TaxID=109636 RepID=A0A9P6CXB4_9AGAR|nr:hypothetical protein BDN70DRAFT_812817 [Pholiota conissans]